MIDQDRATSRAQRAHDRSEPNTPDVRTGFCEVEMTLSICVEVNGAGRARIQSVDGQSVSMPCTLGLILGQRRIDALAQAELERIEREG